MTMTKVQLKVMERQNSCHIFNVHIDNGVADIHFSMYQHVSFQNFHIVVFAENINIDGNVVWVFALQKIEEL